MNSSVEFAAKRRASATRRRRIAAGWCGDGEVRKPLGFVIDLRSELGSEGRIRGRAAGK